MQDFKKLIENLTDNGVEFIIVGGFSAVVHGVTLVTKDLDLCVSFTVENCKAILKSLEGLDPVYRMDVNKRPLKESPESLAKYKNLYISTKAGMIDFLGFISGVGSYEEVAKHTVELSLFERHCRVLSIDGLIKAKREMKEEKDKQMVIQLEAIKEKLKK